MLKKMSFSLIEVLVFVTVFSLFFVIAASVVTVSLRNMKVNEHKIVASHYARQLEEWLRTQKEIEWGGGLCGTCNPYPFTTFTEIVTQGCSGPTCTNKFCFDNQSILGWPSVGACDSYAFDLANFFKREVTFTSIPASGYVAQVNAKIAVQWQELGKTYDVTTKTVFSVLEQ